VRLARRRGEGVRHRRRHRRNRGDVDGRREVGGRATTGGAWHQLSDDALRVEEGSLYPALYRMEEQGLIEAEWRPTENNRTAKLEAGCGCPATSTRNAPPGDSSAI
jgi:hypothetical protein